MNYKLLLKKAKKEMPSEIEVAERFEIPKVKGHIQGNKTIVTNFIQITNTLRREPAHLLKFLLKELATPGEIEKNVLVLGRKVSSSRINEKLESYAKQFVICKECNKPDTKIIKEDNVAFMRCLACGARHPVKYKI